jgi:hypothetical protein
MRRRRAADAEMARLLESAFALELKLDRKAGATHEAIEVLK